MPSLSTAPPVVSVATASAGAPLAATHTTAALLDLVSAAPGTPAAHSAPASDSPVAARSSAKAAQDTRPVSPRHHPSRADTPRANAAAEAQPRGSVQAAAGAAARQFGAAQNAVQSLSALADLLPVAAPNAARQDSSGAALLSPHALVQVTCHKYGTTS